MNLWREYLQPASISEAIQYLETAVKPAVPIAGGTDLLLDLKQGRGDPVHTLVDINSVKEMTVIEIRAHELFIGAAVTVNRIASSSLVIEHAQALVESCHLIAGPQVRNVATLGGNVAHALPAADGTIALTALAAQAEVASASGLRRLPIGKLFLGPGKTALIKGKEILVGFYLPTNQSGQASCFNRIMRPQGVALPILNCAVWLTREKNRLTDVRISIGPGGAIPFRATETEAILRGQVYDSTIFENTLAALFAQIKFRSSPRRATAEYRKHIVRGLLKQTLDTAWSRSS
jgi:CO/xanthine dehydrogenase FAD-binding subunit